MLLLSIWPDYVANIMMILVDRCSNWPTCCLLYYGLVVLKCLWRVLVRFALVTRSTFSSYSILMMIILASVVYKANPNFHCRLPCSPTTFTTSILQSFQVQWLIYLHFLVLRLASFLMDDMLAHRGSYWWWVTCCFAADSQTYTILASFHYKLIILYFAGVCSKK